MAGSRPCGTTPTHAEIPPSSAEEEADEERCSYEEQRDKRVEKNEGAHAAIGAGKQKHVRINSPCLNFVASGPLPRAPAWSARSLLATSEVSGMAECGDR